MALSQFKAQFHDGEITLQKQTRKYLHIKSMAPHMMRDYMPDQHRDFFINLKYIFLGTIDNLGRPHASIVTGKTGFISTPDPKRLVIKTGERQAKPALKDLKIGHNIAILGLDLSNRRRNRMHGIIETLDNESLTIHVKQSYGNCPKYISLREIIDDVPPSSDRQRPLKTISHQALTPRAINLIQNADTFFIASYLKNTSDTSNATSAAYEGADISHRGGHIGFVSVDSDTQITIPDYSGNYLFNTLGNLLLNPKAALLFLDFETGDQLHLQGRATSIDDPAKVAQYAGAQRLLQITIKSMRLEKAVTDLRWRFIEASPFNPKLA